ncbi:receptor activity-modifying protein 1 [Pezoporus flaviventris]|uniref:receptor activity-modifying protein 1 n=1 Tax=Pezoporus flaviventris TaxID=889875 RepID=UPI002AB31AE0|nr:receptor activity-modifying protein 1 [Pezoporus flaviventris]
MSPPPPGAERRGATTVAGGGSCPPPCSLPGAGCAGQSAAAMALLPRRFLCFVLAHHFIAVTACQEADYSWMIQHYCLKQFQLSMEGIGQRLWCDWDETMGTYGELTNCTALIAERLDCYWPNRLVDEFFVAVHKQYFRNCSPSGRALHDPPNSILCPFILLPILITLLMTALVVWRSKRSEGIV